MSNPHLKVLLVEDNPGDARLICEMLLEVPHVRFDVEIADRLATGLVRIRAGDIHAVTLEAEASTVTIVEPVQAGQVITIEWIQGGAGGHTYTWPANCKFAGAAVPPPDLTAGRRDSVTFRYDGTNWLEVSRALGVG